MLLCQFTKVSDKESSITLSMYLGVKWEDSRIRNMNQTVEDLQVMIMMMMVKMLMMAMVMIRMMMVVIEMAMMIEINNHYYYLHLHVLLCRALAFHSFPFCGSQTSRSTM